MRSLPDRLAILPRVMLPAIVAAFLVALGGGGWAALVPLAAGLAFVFVLVAPLRLSALPLLACALMFDNPGERPMEDRWHSPLLAGGNLLYLNLHKHVHIEALRFSLLELLIGVLVILAAFRKIGGTSLDPAEHEDARRNPMKTALACFVSAVIALEVFGLARHGDFKNSLWQTRQLFWLPVLGVVFGHAIKSAADRRMLLRIVVVAACVRAALGAYYYFAICRPENYRPEYTTTHSDSVLAVLAILILLKALAERPSVSHIVLNVVAQPLLAIGLIVNDRRLAFVSLGAGLALLVAMAPATFRRRLGEVFIVLLPFFAAYTAVGWHSQAGVFRPVQTVRSLTTQDDSSSETRDIENFNLICTLKRSPVVGTGFGHEYREVVKAYSVDQIFAQYRFIAHNSVLWLLSLSGFVGFTLLWVLFPVGVLVAWRAHESARAPLDRVTAYGAVVAVLCFVVQAWGDMGLQSWMGTLLLGGFLGAAGTLAQSQRALEVTA